MLASIGGEIVFLGLWLEKEADEDEIKVHLSNFLGDNRLAKLKQKWGWRILMAGILAEVVFGAGLAALDVWANANHKKHEQTIENTLNEVLATGILKTNQIPLLLSNQQEQFQALNNKLLEVINARAPRRINLDQRNNFIVLLSDSHVSKIALPVVVGNNDSETENYAEQFREMLNAAGFGMDAPQILPQPQQDIIFVTNQIAAAVPPLGEYSTQGIRYIPGLFPRPAEQKQTQKEPDIFAVLSDANFISGKTTNPAAFMIFKATPNNPSGGELFAYHPTSDPNAIVVGICTALIKEGISVGFLSSKGILPDGQAGFFIPQKLY